MRALLVLVPAALVGGYIIDNAVERHEHKAPVDPEPIVVEAMVASGISAVAVAPTVTVDLEWAQQLTEMISSEVDDETLEISGSAEASVQASLAAALEVLQSKLERVEFDHEAAVTQISVAGSLLASLAASLEGQLEIETEDGTYVLVTGPDGVRVAEKR